MRKIIGGHMDSLAAGIRKGASSPPAESEPDESSVDDNYVTMPSEPTQTQEWAGDKVLPAAGTQRRQIYDTYLEYPDGLADEEMEAITGLLMNSIRPRRNELMEQGLVVETGRLRPNRNGNPEKVYAASRFAPEGSSESPRPLIAFE